MRRNADKELNMSPPSELVDVGVGTRLLIDPTTLDQYSSADIVVDDQTFKQVKVKSGIYGVIVTDYRGVWLLRTKGSGLTALERAALTT